MNRRDLVTVGMSALAANAVMNHVACATGSASGPAKATAASTGANAAFAARASACVAAGHACMRHCITKLAAGDTSLGQCAKLVDQMIALCQATGPLAEHGSPHLKDFAALCIKVCSDCKAECDKHAGHHAECKGCADACGMVIEEAKKIAA